LGKEQFTMRTLISAGAMALTMLPGMAVSASIDTSGRGAAPEVLNMDCTKHGASKTYRYRLSIDFGAGEFSKSNSSFNVRHQLVRYDDRWVVLGRQLGSEQLPDRTITYDWTEVLNRETGELKTDGYVGPVDMTSRAQCEVAKN
jgi:hypothetical protein